MEDEASPIRPRVLLLACAVAIGIFAASSIVAWRQFQTLEARGTLAELEPANAAASPVHSTEPRVPTAIIEPAREGMAAGFRPGEGMAPAPGVSQPQPLQAPPDEAAPPALAGALAGEPPSPAMDVPPEPPGRFPAEGPHGDAPRLLDRLQEAAPPETVLVPGPAPVLEMPRPLDLAEGPTPEVALEDGADRLPPQAEPPGAAAPRVLPDEEADESGVLAAPPALSPLSEALAVRAIADAVAEDLPPPHAPMPAIAAMPTLAQAAAPAPAPLPAPAPVPAPARARICAGSPTGNYTFAAREIASHAGALGGLEVITTAGSGDNLRRLASGECEMGFSQADVLALRAIEHPQQVAGLDPFKRVYGEYAHILCPVASGWTNASAFDSRTRLIVGGEGSGTAETWRALVRAAPGMAAVQRVNDPVNLVAVNRVKDSRDTCMLWISGLNSSDMQGANRMSANTPDGRRAMRLVSVTSPELRGLRLADGQPIYRFEQITARSGSYENLLDTRVAVNAEGRRFVQGGSVTVPVVDAVLVVRQDFLAKLPGRGSEIVSAVEDAGPAIWARVSPRR